MDKVCIHCGKTFAPNPKESLAQRLRRRFCGRACATRWQAIHRPKPKAAGPCARCGKLVAGLLKGCCKPCYSRERYLADTEHRLQVNRQWRQTHPEFWKTPERLAERRARATRAYHGDETLPAAAFDRDGHRCRHCTSETKLNAHHIDGDRLHRSLDNLVTLCSSCHARLHRLAALQGRTVEEQTLLMVPSLALRKITDRSTTGRLDPSSTATPR